MSPIAVYPTRPRKSPQPKRADSWWNQRFETVALFNSGPSAIVIDDLRIAGESGTNLAPRAIFTCDDHLVWRTKNMALHQLHSQGAIGLVAAMWLIASAFWSRHQGRRVETAQLRCALAGVIAAGMFGGLADTAWITSLTIAVLAFSLPTTKPDPI